MATNQVPYYHVDVFTDKVFAGNGLTVFPESGSISLQNMQYLTQEMRQFESIFLERIEGDGAESHSMAFLARVFAMQEELDFAGHPSLGAGAVLHKLYTPDADEFQCLFKFAKKQVQLTSRKKGSGFIVAMDQGEAELLSDLYRGAELAASASNVSLTLADEATAR